METFTKTSVWVRKCFGQVLLVLTTFPTVTKAKGDSPLCVHVCAVKVLFWRKLFPLSPQLNGFLPVWIRLCAFRFFLRLKLFPQSPQLNEFSPVWFIICLDRFPLGLKVLPQMGQGYDFPLWQSQTWVFGLQVGLLGHCLWLSCGCERCFGYLEGHREGRDYRWISKGLRSTGFRVTLLVFLRLGEWITE